MSPAQNETRRREQEREEERRQARRAQHQPGTAPANANAEAPSAQELRATCGKLAALVLARDAGTAPLSVFGEDGKATSCTGADGSPAPRPMQLFEGEPLVRRIVDMLRTCGVENIEVSAAESLRDEVAGLSLIHI